MKTSYENRACEVGFSLIEIVLALGVLAVSVPLVFLALEHGGRSGMASAADNRGGRMVEVCLEDVRASREGRTRWFTNTRPGTAIPPDGMTWALAFSNEGLVLGAVTAEQWNSGIGRLEGQAVRYLAKIDSEAHLAEGLPEVRKVRGSVEEPAAAPDGRRGKSEFHTLIP